MDFGPRRLRSRLSIANYPEADRGIGLPAAVHESIEVSI
jgi:hypothetical protein